MWGRRSSFFWNRHLGMLQVSGLVKLACRPVRSDLRVGTPDMKLGEIAPPKGAVKKRKRLGCGHGSGHGKTCGKGHKGQKSRSGGGVRPGFEGGQMPLQMRLPKVGFNSPFKSVYQVVNLDDIARRGLSGEITPEVLKKAGLIRSSARPVKVLGRGDVDGVLQVKVQAVSASASDKIARAGGSVEIVSKAASQTE